MMMTGLALHLPVEQGSRSHPSKSAEQEVDLGMNIPFVLLHNLDKDFKLCPHIPGKGHPVSPDPGRYLPMVLCS